MSFWRNLFGRRRPEIPFRVKKFHLYPGDLTTDLTVVISDGRVLHGFVLPFEQFEALGEALVNRAARVRLAEAPALQPVRRAEA
jgi:hypothetical protein